MYSFQASDSDPPACFGMSTMLAAFVALLVSPLMLILVIEWGFGGAPWLALG
jgi:hypothetical protein